ncbi:hypothetical protein Misp02_59740 [Microtetraspora sp. NBRC 16547]|nr:hypothetical protein Misp02_59740 [Microtetraspora sp. NBRC 16547]
MQRAAGKRAAGKRELFGVELDRERVRGSIGAVLGDDIWDASVRVYIPVGGDSPRVFVTARPPTEAARTPQSVRSVAQDRDVTRKGASQISRVLSSALSVRV